MRSLKTVKTCPTSQTGRLDAAWPVYRQPDSPRIARSRNRMSVCRSQVFALGSQRSRASAVTKSTRGLALAQGWLRGSSQALSILCQDPIGEPGQANFPTQAHTGYNRAAFRHAAQCIPAHATQAEAYGSAAVRFEMNFIEIKVHLGIVICDVPYRWSTTYLSLSCTLPSESVEVPRIAASSSLAPRAELFGFQIAGPG